MTLSYQNHKTYYFFPCYILKLKPVKKLILFYYGKLILKKIQGIRSLIERKIWKFIVSHMDFFQRSL